MVKKREVKQKPKLRFPEFDGKWDLRNLGDIGVFKNGLNKDKKDFGYGSPFVNLMDVFGRNVIENGEFDLVNATEKDLRLYDLQKGDVLFIRSSVKREGVGETVLVHENFPNTVYSGFLIRFREYYSTLDLLYKKYCFAITPFRKELLSYATTSANTNINQESLSVLKVFLPTLPEQQKIASFLSAVDQKIQQLTRKKELLEQYKRGVMQKIFSREIRFKDENGKDYPDWEEKRLGDLAVRITTKNQKGSVTFVLTNSATEGVVSQQDYFDKDIANQNNLEGYYIVAKGDFVYNPRISSTAPVGPIKRNKLEKGVMSPLYTVFRFDAENLDYFEYFFETTMWHKYVHSIANFGARHDRMNITNADFLKMPIPYPCKEERDKICLFLTNLTKELDSAKARLILTQTFKNGLLQQMFV